MKVSTLEIKAKKKVMTKKEEIAVEKLIAFDNQIHELERALELVKSKKAEFADMEIEDVSLHEFNY
jgi:hypothetical protein